MIKTKEDLIYYIDEDSKWYTVGGRKRPRMLTDEVWHYLIAMRKLEYCINCNKDRLQTWYWRWRFHRLGIKLGFDIPINTCGPGLCIRHWGNIVVNPQSRIGKNCILQQGVVIGRGNHADEVPIIGDNVYIGPGAKLYGRIRIGDNNAIGANAVVNKTFGETGIVIAGIPAKIVGRKNDELK